MTGNRDASAAKLDATIMRMAEVWDGNMMVLATGDFVEARRVLTDCGDDARLLTVEYVRVREVAP